MINRTTTLFEKFLHWLVVLLAIQQSFAKRQEQLSESGLSNPTVDIAPSTHFLSELLLQKESLDGQLLATLLENDEDILEKYCLDQIHLGQYDEAFTIINHMKQHGSCSPLVQEGTEVIVYLLDEKNFPQQFLHQVTQMNFTNNLQVIRPHFLSYLATIDLNQLKKEGEVVLIDSKRTKLDVGQVNRLSHEAVTYSKNRKYKEAITEFQKIEKLLLEVNDPYYNNFLAFIHNSISIAYENEGDTILPPSISIPASKEYEAVANLYDLAAKNRYFSRVNVGEFDSEAFARILKKYSNAYKKAYTEPLPVKIRMAYFDAIRKFYTQNIERIDAVESYHQLLYPKKHDAEWQAYLVANYFTSKVNRQTFFIANTLERMNSLLDRNRDHANLYADILLAELEWSRSEPDLVKSIKSKIKKVDDQQNKLWDYLPYTLFSFAFVAMIIVSVRQFLFADSTKKKSKLKNDFELFKDKARKSIGEKKYEEKEDTEHQNLIKEKRKENKIKGHDWRDAEKLLEKSQTILAMSTGKSTTEKKSVQRKQGNNKPLADVRVLTDKNEQLVFHKTTTSLQLEFSAEGENLHDKRQPSKKLSHFSSHSEQILINSEEGIVCSAKSLGLDYTAFSDEFLKAIIDYFIKNGCPIGFCGGFLHYQMLTAEEKARSYWNDIDLIVFNVPPDIRYGLISHLKATTIKFDYDYARDGKKLNLVFDSPYYNKPISVDIAIKPFDANFDLNDNITILKELVKDRDTTINTIFYCCDVDGVDGKIFFPLNSLAHWRDDNNKHVICALGDDKIKKLKTLCDDGKRALNIWTKASTLPNTIIEQETKKAFVHIGEEFKNVKSPGKLYETLYDFIARVGLEKALHIMTQYHWLEHLKLPTEKMKQLNTKLSFLLKPNLALQEIHSLPMAIEAMNLSAIIALIEQGAQVNEYIVNDKKDLPYADKILQAKCIAYLILAGGVTHKILVKSSPTASSASLFGNNKKKTVNDSPPVKQSVAQRKNRQF